jgi:hypothetical protein
MDNTLIGINLINLCRGTGPDPAINKSEILLLDFPSDDFLYNDSYSQQNNLLKYLPKPFLISDDEENRS